MPPPGSSQLLLLEPPQQRPRFRDDFRTQTLCKHDGEPLEPHSLFIGNQLVQGPFDLGPKNYHGNGLIARTSPQRAVFDPRRDLISRYTVAKSFIADPLILAAASRGRTQLYA